MECRVVWQHRKRITGFTSEFATADHGITNSKIARGPTLAILITALAELPQGFRPIYCLWEQAGRKVGQERHSRREDSGIKSRLMEMIPAINFGFNKG
ncbi:hypothetical protein BIY26_19760 [Brenneria goodwinii]|uniref:Uncharacterized protein n=1 Tax=Brenneria goodwinii TaxID=1109412 RepID=A0AAE8JLH7_9GAMM|nr:hypothetical protein AWC36_15915 [Brenneria goodwinii]RLM17882.1 hypothetical protein BIY26_19760 [Brenneria goodwinii]